MQLDERKEESNEEYTNWWEKVKDWEGWDEGWSRVKDVIGATIANVIGGRILERWALLEDAISASGRNLKQNQGENEAFERNYNFYFIQYNNAQTNETALKLRTDNSV